MKPLTFHDEPWAGASPPSIKPAAVFGVGLLIAAMVLLASAAAGVERTLMRTLH